VLSDGRRQMVDDEEWDWIVEHSSGAFDHVMIASTLPVFLPRGIHHLQAWNESLCAGRGGRSLASLQRAARRAADLEHWAAVQPVIRAASATGCGGSPAARRAPLLRPRFFFSAATSTAAR
jgi:hypothetical protein